MAGLILHSYSSLGALRVQKLLIFLLVVGGEVASKVASCVRFRLSPSAWDDFTARVTNGFILINRGDLEIIPD